MGPAPGEDFAGYLIERQLGRGGMGVVYLAQHIGLGRRAAVKVLAPELADQEGFKERFVRESQLAASLDHPNIVPVYDAGERDGVLFIAMRYVEGTDLAAVIEHSPAGIEPKRALSLLSQIADALDAAHAAGLVHRDVKPGNVLVGAPTRSGGREWAYLTDFGLTRRLEATTRITRTGMFMGTLQYVAPEHIRGEALDGRADQYALACMLFEGLTGRPPFVKEVEFALLSSHLSEPPPAVTSANPGLPGALDDVLARGMAKTPDERYETCTALLDAAATAALRAGRPPMPSGAASLPAPPVVRSSAPAPTTASSAPPPMTATPPPPPAHRGWKPSYTVAAIAAAVVAGLVGFVAFRDGGSSGSGADPGREYAGEIASPGQVDVYRFDGSAGERVFVDVLAVNDDPQCAVSLDLAYRLIGPGGEDVFPGSTRFLALGACGDEGPVVLPADGAYELQVGAVGGPTDDTGTYSLTIRSR